MNRLLALTAVFVAYSGCMATPGQSDHPNTLAVYQAPRADPGLNITNCNGSFVDLMVSWELVRTVTPRAYSPRDGIGDLVLLEMSAVHCEKIALAGKDSGSADVFFLAIPITDPPRANFAQPATSMYVFDIGSDSSSFNAFWNHLGGHAESVKVSTEVSSAPVGQQQEVGHAEFADGVHYRWEGWFSSDRKPNPATIHYFVSDVPTDPYVTAELTGENEDGTEPGYVQIEPTAKMAAISPGGIHTMLAGVHSHLSALYRVSSGVPPS